jgi:DNA-binding ferritin-like protein
MTHTVQPEVRHAPDAVEENPISVQQNTAEQMIDALNDHVASLFVLFHQYQKHHWVVEGPQFRDLHLMLQEHYTATHAQADDFAERIVTLGGVPVGSMVGQVDRAYINEEAEGVLDLRQMLSNDLQANQQILVKLRESISLAKDLGDYGTQKLLKTHLRAQEMRAQDIMHMLEQEALEDDFAKQD